jgi:hypothetical protein
MKNKFLFLGLVLCIIACSSGGDDSSDTMKDATPVDNTSTDDDPAPTEEAFTLEGVWIRTSTVPADLEGMQVELNDDLTEATIISVGSNSFGFIVGDVKWISIAEKDDDTYDFEDLGRDMQGDTWYSEGVITIVEADEVSLSINNGLPGNEQVWERMK